MPCSVCSYKAQVRDHPLERLGVPRPHGRREGGRGLADRPPGIGLDRPRLDSPAARKRLAATGAAGRASGRHAYALAHRVRSCCESSADLSFSRSATSCTVRNSSGTGLNLTESNGHASAARLGRGSPTALSGSLESAPRRLHAPTPTRTRRPSALANAHTRIRELENPLRQDPSSRKVEPYAARPPRRRCARSRRVCVCVCVTVGRREAIVRTGAGASAIGLIQMSPKRQQESVG
jgi:hypothetical protein